MTMIEKLKELYNREINWRIECFYDAGYTVFLGDDWNGYRSIAHADTLEEAIKILLEEAEDIYGNC